jgi:predicted TIM-barrel fold metal-dependent hydrolase
MIDISTHFSSPSVMARIRAIPGCPSEIVPRRHEASKALFDLDYRVRGLEKLGQPAYRQVLSNYAFHPGLEAFATPDEAADLCSFANHDARAVIDSHPEWFIQAFGMLPFNNPAAASREIDHVRELGLAGIQVPTDIVGKPLDHPEILPVLEEAVEKGLVIFLHPARYIDVPDFAAETESQYGIWMVFGWPFATTAAMVHLAASGIFDRYPDAVFITHHLGGFTPYQEARARIIWGHGRPTDDKTPAPSTRETIDRYLNRFYGDTAVLDGPASIPCGLEFFGSEHVVFGSDAGPDFTDDGIALIQATFKSLDTAGVSEDVLDALYRRNPTRILGLDESARAPQSQETLAG